MKPQSDLTGLRFGRYTVLRYTGKAYWQCRCDCGTERAVYGTTLRSGKSRSCGCRVREIASVIHKTHGQTETPLYKLWTTIKNRCYNPNNRGFKDYGGRGIQIDYEPWRKDFVSFRDWALANGFSSKSSSHALEIDRKNNSLGYSPENCRFVTPIVNANNKRNSHWLSAYGERKTIAQWSRDRRCAVGIKTLSTRICRGWSDQAAITTPRKGGSAWQG